MLKTESPVGHPALIGDFRLDIFGFQIWATFKNCCADSGYVFITRLLILIE